jgi:FG-GAP repeat
VPAAADYDGDGRADLAVYRDGTWFILRSSNGAVTATDWGGLAQDVAVPGDYDGEWKGRFSGVPRRSLVCPSILEWRSNADGLGRTRTGHTAKSPQ